MTIDPKTFSPQPGEFKDKTFLITGASDGIGRALAIGCARFGATVLIAGRSVEKLEAVYDEILAVGAPRPSIIALDFAQADGDAYTALSDSVAAENDALHGLVNNAGLLGDLSPFEHYDLVTWQQVMHVNVTAAVALTQVLMPNLKSADSASVIFSSSSVGRKGRAYWGAYSVSKFAIEGFSQVLADENRKSGLRVNCVNPGSTRTDMRLKAFPAEDRSKLPTPEEVLAPYYYLLSDASVGCNGESLDAQ